MRINRLSIIFKAGVLLVIGFRCSEAFKANVHSSFHAPQVDVSGLAGVSISHDLQNFPGIVNPGFGQHKLNQPIYPGISETKNKFHSAQIYGPQGLQFNQPKKLQGQKNIFHEGSYTPNEEYGIQNSNIPLDDHPYQVHDDSNNEQGFNRDQENYNENYQQNPFNEAPNSEYDTNYNKPTNDGPNEEYEFNPNPHQYNEGPNTEYENGHSHLLNNDHANGYKNINAYKDLSTKKDYLNNNYNQNQNNYNSNDESENLNYNGFNQGNNQEYGKGNTQDHVRPSGPKKNKVNQYVSKPDQKYIKVNNKIHNPYIPYSVNPNSGYNHPQPHKVPTRNPESGDDDQSAYQYSNNPEIVKNKNQNNRNLRPNNGKRNQKPAVENYNPSSKGKNFKSPNHGNTNPNIPHANGSPVPGNYRGKQQNTNKPYRVNNQPYPKNNNQQAQNIDSYPDAAKSNTHSTKNNNNNQPNIKAHRGSSSSGNGYSAPGLKKLLIQPLFIHDSGSDIFYADLP